MSAEIDQKVSAIRDRFVRKTAAREEALREMISRLQSPDWHGSAREAAQMGHSLAGAAGTFGFDTLGKCADDVERQADLLLASGGTDTRALQSACKRLLEEISLISATRIKS